jgi:hypothetical protein
VIRPLNSFVAYELYIYPPNGATPTATPQSIIAAFASADLPCSEQPDQFGHWLVLDGVESALNLTIKDDVVTGGGFRFVTEDDESVIQRVADVFKSVGFLVSDDEGEL